MIGCQYGREGVTVPHDHSNFGFAPDQRWQVPIYFIGCELAALRPTGQLIVLRVPKFVADKSSNGILASVDFGA